MNVVSSRKPIGKLIMARLEKLKVITSLKGHNFLLIKINRTAGKLKAYKAARYAWKINPVKAEKAEFVLAVDHGKIVDVFEDVHWKKATVENFPKLKTNKGRFGFSGRRAKGEIRGKYIGKFIPRKYRKKGAANPISYSWK